MPQQGYGHSGGMRVQRQQRALLTMASRGAILLLLALLTNVVHAEQLRIAVAANFQGTLKKLVAEFEAMSEHSVILSSGSTGRHYAQIINGAPFDIFLAADAARPELLLAEGYASEVFDYAIGQLFLWRGTSLTADAETPQQWLLTADLKRLAIANPRLAPYGQAALQTIEALGLSERLSNKLVTGENIAQTFQFVASGNAGAGFVAYAQIVGGGIDSRTGWVLPASLHAPLVQRGALLSDTRAAVEFLEFLRGQRAQAIIQANGYQLPQQ